jgi:SAM-dependent methyltransferase
MELKNIKEHWDNLAAKYAEDLKSTTKTPTIKQLEINALYNSLNFISASSLNVLEVGCGNGHNLMGLANLLKQHNYTGVDYSATMISNAINIKGLEKLTNVNFFVGNVVDLQSNENLQDHYDVVFTDRCLINLNTFELQKNGLEQLVLKTKDGGHIIIIENINQSYNNQNDCRVAIGMEARKPDEYNLFFNENEFVSYATEGLNLKLLQTSNFGSLHDLLLYVLIPKTNGGKTDYSHPLMEAVTELLLSLDPKLQNSFGEFGQNKLYIFKKEEK